MQTAISFTESFKDVVLPQHAMLLNNLLKYLSEYTLKPMNEPHNTIFGCDITNVFPSNGSQCHQHLKQSHGQINHCS